MHHGVVLAFNFLLLLLCPFFVEAATLRVSPETGVYTAGNTITANVIINTEGSPVNAAEGVLAFNPSEIQVLNVSRAASIFNLWTIEPTFSNAAGTITFGGGSPTGYTGSFGTVMSVSFRVTTAGSPKINFRSGSVLAADGRGTNVLKSMSGANYSVVAPSASPQPEYVAPPDTPSAPVITSNTHPDPEKWSEETTAELSWTLPSDIVAVRTLLNQSAGTIPTKLYETPISHISIPELPEGESYFHIQFKNDNGWGRTRHYRLAVDTGSPTRFDITQPDGNEPSSPEQTLLFHIEDVSPVKRYLITLDDAEVFEYKDLEETGMYTFTDLTPGRHTVIVEAFDSVGKSLIASYVLVVTAFDKPLFTEYPERINESVIPALKGATKENAEVTVHFSHIGSGNDATEYTVQSNDSGEFVVIPDGPLERGVYEVTAIAIDKDGAQSERSDSIRIAVEPPGYVQLGGIAVDALSVLIPLIALVILLFVGMWYARHRFLLWRRRVRKETQEVEEQLAQEFKVITENLEENVMALSKSRKGKLTKAESELIGQLEADIKAAKTRIQKEIADVENVVK